MIPSCLLYTYIMVFLLIPMEGKKVESQSGRVEKTLTSPHVLAAHPEPVDTSAGKSESLRREMSNGQRATSS